MSSLEDYMLPCLNKQLFGFDCPGCGLQRSVLMIFRGEFADAFFMYPAIYTIIPLFLLIGLNFFFKFKHATKIINILALVSVTTIIVNYLIKIFN